MNPNTCGASPFPGCDEVVANGMLALGVLALAIIGAIIIGSVIADVVDKRKERRHGRQG